MENINIHNGFIKYVPLIISESRDAVELYNNRQFLLQLFDKQLISARTLLAGFGIDIDVELEIDETDYKKFSTDLSDQ